MIIIVDVRIGVNCVFDVFGVFFWLNLYVDYFVVVEEEYSRVIDFERYYVFMLCLQVWQMVFVKLCDVDVDIMVKGWGWLQQWWLSFYSDMLFLYVLVVIFDQVFFVGLFVILDVDFFDIILDCVCDVCDYGLEDFLWVFDVDLVVVVDGSFVVVIGLVVNGELIFYFVGIGQGCVLIWGGDEVGLLVELEVVIDVICSGDDLLLLFGCIVLYGRLWL